MPLLPLCCGVWGSSFSSESLRTACGCDRLRQPIHQRRSADQIQLAIIITADSNTTEMGKNCIRYHFSMYPMPLTEQSGDTVSTFAVDAYASHNKVVPLSLASDSVSVVVILPRVDDTSKMDSEQGTPVVPNTTADDLIDSDNNAGCCV